MDLIRWFLRWIDGAEVVVTIPGRVNSYPYRVLLYQGRLWRHRQFIGSVSPFWRSNCIAWQEGAEWVSAGKAPSPTTLPDIGG